MYLSLVFCIFVFCVLCFVFEVVLEMYLSLFQRLLFEGVL